ncbi:bifunctional 2-polyprenyl-6-hydroxyphenol methylase/3-demethylubiquinol 3-O-methyltransferase UbiG [Frankia sp. B2]|uniref:class I SAM-dependent methyltransferase n=1 Tax=Frankia sp. B2 TaxID=2541730 RepID=UPI00141AC93F|nr:class I SAM-dependent methyltransferase [Frankia sp. B2]
MPSREEMWLYYNKRRWKPYPPEVVRRKYQPFLAAVREEVPRGESILDVGCDHGHFAAQLAESGYRTAGADIDGAALAYAAERYGLNVYQGDLPDIDVGRTFDAITILSSLEHTNHPFEVLSAAARILRPGGMLLISTPRGDGLIPGLSRRLFAPALGAWEFLGPPSHLTYFTRSSLVAMLRRAGFAKITFRHHDRDSAYKIREFAEVVDLATGAPGWARTTYPLLRHLRRPARLIGRGDMLLCVARSPEVPGAGPVHSGSSQ